MAAAGIINDTNNLDYNQFNEYEETVDKIPISNDSNEGEVDADHEMSEDDDKIKQYNELIKIKQEKFDNALKECNTDETGSPTTVDKKHKKIKKHSHKNSKSKKSSASEDKENRTKRRTISTSNVEPSKKSKISPKIVSIKILENPITITPTKKNIKTPEIQKVANEQTSSSKPGTSIKNSNTQQKATDNVATIVEDFKMQSGEEESFQCEGITDTNIPKEQMHITGSELKYIAKKIIEKNPKVKSKKKTKKDKVNEKSRKFKSNEKMKENRLKCSELQNSLDNKQLEIEKLQKEIKVLQDRNGRLQDKILFKIDEYAARNVNPFALEAVGDIPLGFHEKKTDQLYCGFGTYISVNAYYKAVNASLSEKKLKTKDKGFSIFVKDVAEAIIGREVLKSSSVKGRACNAIKGSVAKQKIDDQLVLAVKEIFRFYLVDQRQYSMMDAQLELGQVNTYIANKISDLNKKQKQPGQKESKGAKPKSKEPKQKRKLKKTVQMKKVNLKSLIMKIMN